MTDFGLYDSDPALERSFLGTEMVLSEQGTPTTDQITLAALADLRARDFNTPAYRHVYAAMVALAKSGSHFGLRAVASRLDKKGHLARAGSGNGSLSELDLREMQNEMGQPPAPRELAHQLRALGERRDIRRMLAQVEGFLQETHDPSQIRAFIRDRLMGLDGQALVQEVKGQGLDELLATEFGPLIPVVPHLVYAGTSTLVVGGSKAGKSFLLLGMALAVAGGGSALGDTLAPQPARPVLYLNLDDGPRRLQARARDMLVALPRPPPGFFQVHDQWPPLDRGGEGMLRTWAERHHEGLVVIDLLENIRPERTAGSVYASDYRAMRPLSDMAHQTGATFLIAHHTNKRGLGSEEFDPILAISGSMGLPGAVDGMLVFRPTQQEVTGTHLTLIHRDAPRGEYLLMRDELLNGWRFDGEDFTQGSYRGKKPPSKERLDIIDECQKAGRPLKPGEIAERLGKPANAVYYLLFKMRNTDPPQMVQHPDGTYQPANEVGR